MKRNILISALLFIIATLFVVLFLTGAGFIYKDRYGYDSAIFMYVGKAMKFGYVPYRDLFDIKGPMLFLIQYIGQKIGGGVQIWYTFT